MVIETTGPDRYSISASADFEATPDTVLKEEIYERTVSAGEHLLRYRALEPALGVQEYDAVLRLQQLPGGRCAFEAVRVVRLDADSSPDMLSEMVRSETQCLADHFAR